MGRVTFGPVLQSIEARPTGGGRSISPAVQTDGGREYSKGWVAFCGWLDSGVVDGVNRQGGTAPCRRNKGDSVRVAFVTI